MPTVPVLLAAAGGGQDLSGLGQFGQFGALGALVVALIWFAKGSHQRERDRADRLEEETRRLNDRLAEENTRFHNLIASQVIPVLDAAARSAEESNRLLQAMQREREVAEIAAKRSPRERKEFT